MRIDYRWILDYCGRLFVLIGFIGLILLALFSLPRHAEARARLIAVFPIRSTPDLAPRASEVTHTIVLRLAAIDGYDAKSLPNPVSGTLGMTAASSGAELYVVGQLLASDSGFQLVLASFEAATDKPVGNYRCSLQTTTQLPEQPDIRTLLQSVSPGASATAAPDTAGGVIVPTGLPISIILDAPISSSSAQVGDTFAFKAAKDVITNGYVVIQKGAQGEGQIALAERAGGNGHPGKLGLQFNWIAGVDGSKIQLTDTPHTDEGEAKKGASSTASIATYILLGPLGLFAHNFVKGRDITLDERSKITAYVDHTVHISSQTPETAQPGFAK